MAATPALLAEAVASLGPERMERPRAPGKWSPREILCHLADCEIAFAFRLRQVTAEEGHVIQPFDQGKWAEHYGGYDADAALATFSALRQWNLVFLETLPPESSAKKLTHPERGDMQFQDVIGTIAGHDLNHLGQLEAMSR